MKYDRIGVGYDTTRRADPRIAQRLLALLQPASGELYLDIGCGTGNYTHALRSQGLDIVGIDQSAVMLDTARAKYPTIAWHQADVAALPFADAHFDGAVCTQAIHHFPDLDAAFCEISRVLKGGRLVMLTSTRDQMRSYWLNEYFPKAMARAIDQLPSDRELRTALKNAQLRIVVTEPWFVPNDPVDLFLYSGKHNPTIYLDERVRQGISTFANLAERDEVEQGLVHMKDDIATGKIAELQARYASNAGDYLFIVAQHVREQAKGAGA